LGSVVKVKRVRMSNGEMYSILTDEEGMPLTYPNLFVTINHRNASDASNTCFAVYERIIFLYEICDFLNIDLVQRCLTGDFLSRSEMESLALWARRKVNSFREHVEKQKSKKVVSIQPKRKKLETARATFVINDNGNVASSTAYNRLTSFAEYIGWLEKTVFPTKNSSSEDVLKSLRPRKFSAESNVENFEENYKSLTINQMTKVLDVVRPESPENPCKNKSLKYRNQLIVNLFEATGCRRGELLKIRIQDIKTSPKNGRRYLTLRSKVDLEDNRSDRPEGKTLSRNVPLDKRLVDMYEDYLLYHRSEAKGVEHIPYLFVTHNHRTSVNNALSLASVNKLCRQISSVVGFRVHPHTFRHTWNDRFSEHADKQIAKGEVSPAKSESDRQKLMGWSEGSKMALHYSRRHSDKRAFEVGLKLQEEGSRRIDTTLEKTDNPL
jgi:integrase